MLFHYSVLASLALVNLASAANAFVGCRTALISPIAGSGRMAANPTLCSTQCLNTYGPSFQPPTFLYSVFGTASDGWNCHCSADVQDYMSIQSSQSVASPATYQNGNFAVTRLGTSFTLSGCYATASVGSIGQASDCFAFCSTSRSTMIGIIPSDGPMCYCELTATLGPAEVCGRSTVFVYSRSVAAAASGVMRRREKVAKRAAQEEMAKRLCPFKRLACIIPGTDSYECIDLSIELESCGGCINGTFGTGNTTSTGTE
ncbi:uncharacterized protein MKK02DRAFT_42163 [Dioszegia hungarica]|uniref:WSC domain-containing protein n=1 Tax=Dioszegia hungarica TaxID=4972 RepID=A0AA38HD18_9TREE|nr:uncharacterized protein MKK02DRAFT_42163 [Dioszegia hungarica]KAI9637792.1 hypothetical protein MKK02DRAFT_42163 [Dioszegia hungarica]